MLPLFIFIASQSVKLDDIDHLKCNTHFLISFIIIKVASCPMLDSILGIKEFETVLFGSGI